MTKGKVPKQNAKSIISASMRKPISIVYSFEQAQLFAVAIISIVMPISILPK
jgi:hypothetical protein